MKTSAFHHSAPGKADRMSALSVKPAARGFPCPLAGRSRRPSRPPFTARPPRFAIQASLASVARSRTRAAPRSPAVLLHLTPHPLRSTSLPTGDRMSPMTTSGMMKTSAFHHAAQGKADRMSALSVKSNPVLMPRGTAFAAAVEADARDDQPVTLWPKLMGGRHRVPKLQQLVAGKLD